MKIPVEIRDYCLTHQINNLCQAFFDIGDNEEIWNEKLEQSNYKIFIQIYFS